MVTQESIWTYHNGPEMGQNRIGLVGIGLVMAPVWSFMACIQEMVSLFKSKSFVYMSLSPNDLVLLCIQWCLCATQLVLFISFVKLYNVVYDKLFHEETYSVVVYFDTWWVDELLCLYFITSEHSWWLIRLRHQCGCWWPGAILAPGHQQPQCWLNCESIKTWTY